MDNTVNRTSISSLRTSDSNKLMVLTQDVLSQPVNQIEPSTLVDLIALSELDDQLPTSLNRDLEKFRKNAFRQIDDLPDGPILANFVRELSDLDPQDLPQTLRDFMAELLPQRRNADALETLQELAERLEGQPPAEIVLPKPAPVKATSKKTTKKKAADPKKKRRTRMTASQVDDRRAEWIEEDVIDRLSNYGNRGLKESIIVAGSRHRASWEDLSEAEILAVLRRLKRESKVRYSAGRWMIAS